MANTAEHIENNTGSVLNTMAFRTKQEKVSYKNPAGYQYIIALDAGYSSMKVFTESKCFCFPSYAMKINHRTLEISSERDILYRDMATGDVYMIGYVAQDMISSDSTNDTDGEMYSRKRYNNPKFKILCEAAIGLALMDKSSDDMREIVLQTGLPGSYLEGDSSSLRKSLSRPANFAIKAGSGEWRTFSYEIKPKNISIIAQPVGSYYSVMIDNYGRFTKRAKDYLYDGVLILDIGFGTFDLYGIKNRQVACNESVDEIGMRKVLSTVTDMIREEYGEDIRVQAFQKNLETGYVTCVDEENLKSEDKSIAELLERASEEVFQEAFSRAKAITSSFRGYKHVIVTGGTGEAWYGKISRYLSGMKSIDLVPGNINDPELPFIYSNVRGYYMICYAKGVSERMQKAKEKAKSVTEKTVD